MLRKITAFELERDIGELNQAIAQHYIWSSQLTATALFHDTPDPEIMDTKSHLHCRFSKWLAIRLRLKSFEDPEFKLIEERHAAIHATMRELLLALQQDRLTRAQLQDYYATQRAFLDAIDRYKTELIELRNNHDTLTGLPLRKLLYRDFPLLQQAAHRNAASSLYLTLIDIDHFKQVNDKYGHTTGDAVLRELGSLLYLNSRSQDKTYRFGGEEFILLHVCDSDAAFNATLERLMAQIRAHNFVTPTGTLQITVTCGAVHAVGDEELQTLIEQADRAMYLGKQQGRNRIFFCPHLKQAPGSAGEAICW